MRVRDVAAGPLFADDSSFGARVGRRAKGLVLEVGLFVVLTPLLPLALVAAALVDLALWARRRKPWVAVRLVAMAWWFLFGEMQALVGELLIWILSGGPFGTGSLRRRRWMYGLRIHWARSHLGGVRTLFGLTLDVQGVDEAGPGPVLIMMRHASIIDNALPDATVGRAHGMGLRFVIKRELNVLPTIDIGGRWVPTYFVRRGSSDAAGEIAALAGLTEDLGPGEGVLIYPEGTRKTDAKLARAQAIIAERQPELAPLASRLKNVLPPRLGGPLALLEAAPGVDVVFCAHVGFDGFAKVSDIWAGKLVGGTIRVCFWRHDAATIPVGEEARTAWLYERWQEVDDWIGSHRADPSAEPSPELARA
jgi:1-acyl-sn-glycerol-3-phosphate acyltransferase